GNARADITYDPKAPVPLVCRASASLSNGTLRHASLPEPLEQVELTANCVNRLVPEINFSARMGKARLSARVTDLPIPSGRNELEALPEAMRELVLKADNLPVAAALLARLPEKLQFIQSDYSPQGPAAVEYHYRRDTNRPLRQWTVRALGMNAEFSGFRYALS